MTTEMFLSYLAAKGLASVFMNWSQQRQLQNSQLLRLGSVIPQQNQHQKANMDFKRFVQSLYGEEFDSSKIQCSSREISYAVSEAMTVSYDYNNYYLLIKVYLETKDLPKETLRTRILGDDHRLSQVFMSIPYDAICIAMPPSCHDDSKTVKSILNRMESILAENAETTIAQS